MGGGGKHLVQTDRQNREMMSFWTIAPAKEEDCRMWVCANVGSFVWSRFIFWKKRLGLPENLKSIDVGCGYGKFSMTLGVLGADVALLDYNARSLDVAVRAHRLLGLNPAAVNCDLLSLPEELSCRYDMVCSFGTLEHFSGENRLEAFRAHCRLLRQGGLLFVVVPNRHGFLYRIAFGLRRRLGRVPADFFEEPFSRKELTAMAASCGVAVLELEGARTIVEDYRYWIMENVRSLCRKLFRLRGRAKPADGGAPRLPAASELLELREFRRSFLDRRFSSMWLLIGRKEELIEPCCRQQA